MRATWKFILVESKDLKPVGELTQAHNRSLTLTLNRAGSLSFTIPMDDEVALVATPIIYGVIAYRVGSTGSVAVWSGYINTIEEDVLNNSMTVNCVGWLDRLSKRILRKTTDLSLTTMDDGLIIGWLWYYMEGRNIGTGDWVVGTTSFVADDGSTVRWPANSSPNTSTWLSWGGFSDNEGTAALYDPDDIPAYPGITPYTQAPRTVQYTPWQTNILQAIQGLTEIENGCDVDVDPISREFFVYRKKRRILSSVVFGYQVGPSNVAQFGRQLDGSTLANYAIATGAAGTIGGYAEDSFSQNAYGTHEEAYALSDVQQTNILQSYAAAEVAVKFQPRQMFSVTPVDWTSDNSSPEPFVDYRIGDQVNFIAFQSPRINFDYDVRIFGISMTIDDEGNERIGQLQIYPGG